jgi:hypothetical protein
MQHKYKFFSLPAAVVALTIIQPALANTLDELLGDWRNVNANSGGIVRLLITKKDDAINVQAWGACHPEPCDWHSERATVYGPLISPPDPNRVEYLTVIFIEKILLVIGSPPGRTGELRAIVLDGKGRSNVGFDEIFKKTR